jgi:hypothetical protein
MILSVITLALAAALVLALCLIPRPFDRSRITIALLVLGFLAAFGVGSWLLSLVFAGVGNVAYKVEALGVPAPLIILSPLLLVGILGWLGRLRAPRPVVATVPSQDRYVEDDAWYSSQWRSNAADLGTAGYRLELVDGPLAGRTARLRDSRHRLWVASPEQGGELIVRGAIARPDLQGVTLLGAYEFSHGDEAMVWTPAVV